MMTSRLRHEVLPDRWFVQADGYLVCYRDVLSDHTASLSPDHNQVIVLSLCLPSTSRWHDEIGQDHELAHWFCWFKFVWPEITNLKNGI